MPFFQNNRIHFLYTVIILSLCRNINVLLMKRVFLMAAVAVCACEHVDHTGELPSIPDVVASDTVARLLASLHMSDENLAEVHDAVSSSAGNGYDEEYMMRDLFASPGTGVGGGSGDVSTKSYSTPLRDLIRERLYSTKSSSGGMSADRYINALENSDMQIYWPYSESWDGKSYPVITFDPGGAASANIGYAMSVGSDGDVRVEEVVVDEVMAMSRPVWIVNRNDDCLYESIEMLRRRDPDWGQGGGDIIVRPNSAGVSSESNSTRIHPLDDDFSEDAGVLEVTDMETSETRVKSLVIKDFKMRRNYDSWFAGASEFFVKCGAVEDFTASTEAELRLYSPSVTDFMLVVRRRYLGETVPFNAMLVSKWTDQLDNMALMITEDDGGTRTDWKCSAVVKIKSKSYGFDVSLPFNSRDDIVWRGSLSGKYLEKYDGVTSRFGDVDITFAFQ